MTDRETRYYVGPGGLRLKLTGVGENGLQKTLKEVHSLFPVLMEVTEQEWERLKVEERSA